MIDFDSIDREIARLSHIKAERIAQQAAEAEARRVASAKAAGRELSDLIALWNAGEKQQTETGMRLLLLANSMGAELPRLGLVGGTRFTTPPTDRGYQRAHERWLAGLRAGLDRSVHQVLTHNPDVVADIV